MHYNLIEQSVSLLLFVALINLLNIGRVCVWSISLGVFVPRRNLGLEEYVCSRWVGWKFKWKDNVESWWFGEYNYVENHHFFQPQTKPLKSLEVFWGVAGIQPDEMFDDPHLWWLYRYMLSDCFGVPIHVYQSTQL